MMQKNHIELMEVLPQRVSANVLANVQVEGAQQISRNDMVSMLSELAEKISLQISEREPSVPSVPATPAAPDTQDGFRYYAWGGKFRPIPEGWRFPHGKVKAVCDLFITGYPHDTSPIRPFQYFACSTLVREDQSYFSKAEYVFNKLRSVALEIETVTNEAEFKNMSILRWDVVFAIAFEYIVSAIEAKVHKVIQKPGEMSISTFYDYVKML
jgi:hypothetical protein